MAEDTPVSAVEQTQVSAEPVSQEVAPAQASEQAAPAAPAEKMLSQSHVQSLMARETRLAAERARAEVTAQFERERAEQQQQYAPQGQQQQTGNLGGVQQYSESQIRQMIQEQAYQMTNMETGRRLETEYRQKINAEMQKDPEFADLYDALNIEQHPDLVLLVNQLDNTAAIVKDIAKNPAKFSNVLMLARSGSPKLAHIELQKLSNSIKANEAAQKQTSAPEPLGQMKPSNIGADNGDMSVSDYRKIFIA